MAIDFYLPSNTKKTIHLREATVADALDFCTCDPAFEEAMTTRFLNQLQDKHSNDYLNSAQWTADDRRYALFLYHAMTTEDKTFPITYTCYVCGKEHAADIQYSDIIQRCKVLPQEKRFGEFLHDGHNIVARPLLGSTAETIENIANSIVALTEHRNTANVEERRKIEGEIKQRTAQMNLYQILGTIDMPHFDAVGTEVTRKPKVQQYLETMPVREFYTFLAKYQEAMKPLAHGLCTKLTDGRLVFDLPPVRCPERPNSKEMIFSYSFRSVNYIPLV